ncbi:MAG: glycoside hydrolase family 2 [Planctomycetota bacterium]|nr:glycoside hydrolase family 2 [Planctomycetota bacterium]
MKIACFSIRVWSVVVLLVLGSGRAHAGEPVASAPAPQPLSSAVVSLDGDQWLLAVDPKNVGREENWFDKAPAEVKPARVPGIIQEVFPCYHGVAWYWRELTPAANAHAGGRYLLRFWNVDYLADVWVNGVHVGQHEGACEPFVLDVTDAVKPGVANRLAVRVLNPTNEPIDGIRLQETAHTAKTVPWTPGRGGDWGGLCDSVEFIVAPAVRVEDVFVRADPKTGVIRVQANVRNAGQQAVAAQIAGTVSPAVSGETLQTVRADRELPPGDTLIETTLQVDNPRVWELNDPYLYRVTVSVTTKSSHSGFEMPVGMTVPLDPDFIRRDVLNCKAMGMNMIRSFNGLAPRRLLDFCDELGFLVYQENYSSWFMEASPKMAERFQRALKAMVKRDRNHASVVLWGVLNETPKGPVVDQAVASLQLIRELDDTRAALLNSGNWSGSEATYANPGVDKWESVLADQHPYQKLPHGAGVIHALRTAGAGEKPLFISEYGIGSAVDAARLTRHYEQIGNTTCEDAVFYRRVLDQFLADWNRWNLGDTFANPEDYFHQCLAWMAGLRKLGVNAIRSNPNVIGHSVTGTQDQGLTGEGLTATVFRELKPGVVDAMFDAFYPLRWCLFVEPMHVYRGQKVRLEAVLANEDALQPGDYPVRLQIVGPRGSMVFDRTITVKVPDPAGKPDPKFVLPVFNEEVPVDGPAGRYRLLATFEKGAAATGGDLEFYVADRAEMPAVPTEVVLWGDDPDVAKWLGANGIKTRPFASGQQAAREVVLVGCRAAAGEAEAFREFARHIARGSCAVFLSPEVFQKDKHPTHWLPLAQKGTRGDLPVWVYHKDDWTKNHPIFEGLPCGCIMDHTYYREIISKSAWMGQDVPAEVVAGMIDTSCGYNSGLSVAVYRLGEGRLTLNTLRIRENLGKDPVAERLLRNMLRHAAKDVTKPLADLPAGFDQQLKAIGY